MKIRYQFILFFSVLLISNSLWAEDSLSLADEISFELSSIFKEMDLQKEAAGTTGQFEAGKFVYFSPDYQRAQTVKSKVFKANDYFTDAALTAANASLKVLDDKGKRTIIYYKWYWCSEKEPTNGCNITAADTKTRIIEEAMKGIGDAQRKVKKSSDINVLVCFFGFYSES